MGKKKTRVEVHTEREALTDNPFASLAGGEAPAPAEPASVKVEIVQATWSVAKTRKGGWPLRLEKRSGGKFATIVSNVDGDGDALFRALKKACAAGGKAGEHEVEIQGNHVDRVAKFLDGCGGRG